MCFFVCGVAMNCHSAQSSSHMMSAHNPLRTGFFSNMVVRIRNNSWKDDDDREEILRRYVKGELRREEIMDFVSRDFSQYAWSLRTLDRRLHYFQICHTDRNVAVDNVEAAVKKELEGSGKLLGYRALHKKIRQVYDLNVPRDLVYAVMYNVDPEALKQKVPQFKIRKPSDSSDSKQLSCLYKSTVGSRQSAVGSRQSTVGSRQSAVERLAYKRRKHFKLNRHETHSFERANCYTFY